MRQKEYIFAELEEREKIKEKNVLQTNSRLHVLLEIL